MTHKLTVLVPDDTKKLLDSIKQDTEMSATLQVAKGINVLKYILDAQKAGEQFRVYDKDGRYRVLEIMF